MMEYLCPIYLQKFSVLAEALSAALFSVFRTLKNARARARLFEKLALLLFTEDYVPRVWPPVLRLRLFPASILFALLRTLLAEVAAQLRELGGMRQAIAESGVDASASLSRTKRESACPDSLYMQIAQ
jgi:hypothetical protein